MTSSGPTPRARRNTPHVSLKTCREARGDTQADVAQRLGIGEKLLGKYETGARDVPARLATRFAEAYGINDPNAIVWGDPTGDADDEDEESDLPKAAGL